jgi:hypothetical protein
MQTVEEIKAEIARLQEIRNAWQQLGRMMNLELENERHVYELIRRQVRELNIRIGELRFPLDEGYVIA